VLVMTMDSNEHSPFPDPSSYRDVAGDIGFSEAAKDEASLAIIRICHQIVLQAFGMDSTQLALSERFRGASNPDSDCAILTAHRHSEIVDPACGGASNIEGPKGYEP
jgi:hypothetical protein